MTRSLIILLVSLLSAAPSLSEENSQSITSLKQAARKAFDAAGPQNAHEHLKVLLNQYRAEHSGNPSWRGEYQWSRHLAEVAHEYLRAGQLDDAWGLLGQAADLDVPLRKGLDNGLASAAGGLHRQLAALSSDERYELLHLWSMPTDSRRTVRVLEAFVPTLGPPPAFAKAFGERPRASSFAIARIGEISGLFSTAWELVAAADDAGRLRRLRSELEGLAGQGVANAEYVLTLARVVESRRAHEGLQEQLANRLARLQANQAKPTTRTQTFDGAWQYGHGEFDTDSQRTIEFTPFPHWTGAAWQISATRPHSGFGFLRIDQTGGHPSPHRSCIRRWTAPHNGTLSITGTMYHPAEIGNGVRGRVVSSRTGLLGELRAHDGPVETRIQSIEVEAGETIDFLVDIIDNNLHDTMVWMVQLRLQASDGHKIYDSVADFCGPHDKTIVSDTVLAAACLERKWLQPIGEELLSKLIDNTFGSDKWINRPHEYNSRLIRPVLRRAWATAVRSRVGGTSSELLEDVKLRDWIPAGPISGGRAPGLSHNTWLAHQDHILHLAGSQRDQLFFKYPLTGDFEFTFETQTGGRPGTDGGVAYGGLRYQVNVADELFIASGARSRTAGPFSQLTSRSRRFHGQYVGQAEFHRFTLSSSSVSNHVTLSSKGQRIWTDDSQGKASPWIALRADGDRNPIFRNLKFAGDPVIPREVRISEDKDLRGWFVPADGVPQVIDETSARMRQADEKARVSNANFRIPYFLATNDILSLNFLDQVAAQSMAGGDAAEWFATGGVMHGSRLASRGDAVAQSWICYSRPLVDGESISYEFLYEPGQHEVHPALGRLAFLIERAGVRMHWITDGDREWTGLAEDNAITEPFDRRGPRPLPLVSGDWNRLSIRIDGLQATLSLNDEEICQRQLRPQDDCTFGFYHDANHSSARVRNVVMRGDWPERLSDDQLNNVAAISDPDHSRADRLALNAVFGDKYIAGDIMATRRRAADMSPEERYAFLADWVLPSRNHATYRLYGAFGPTHPAPPVADYTVDEKRRLDAAKANGAGRIQTGGVAVAPALDLIAVAKQLDRLDALRERVEAETSGRKDKTQRRSQLALLILIDIARQDFPAADQRLEEFRTLAIEPPFLAEDRWPEMLVFFEALRHQATYQLVGESVISVTEGQVRNSEGTGSELHDRHLLALTGAKRHLDNHASIETYLNDSPLKQWVPVSKVTANTRGRGMPIARWSPADKSVVKLAGHANDFLYFQSPLQGNYQLDGEVSASAGWRDAGIKIGGQWVLATWDMKYFDRGDFREQLGTHPIDPPMWKRSDVRFLHYRAAVKDQVATTFINGRKIREEQLGGDYDPWVALRCDYDRLGVFRDLRITGNPVIPAEVNLLHDATLTGWVPYYDERISSEHSHWRYDQEEMIGRRHPRPDGSTQESLVYYHRPMLEDGAIEYEFFYDRDQSHVHPALDRVAFLLAPGGVKIHWCTDGIHDRTGLSPSNAQDEPENRRGPDRLPLKTGAWNKMKLTLTGNKLDLALNGELVYQHRLKPSNMRQFGLFHYSDRSEARVRDIRWKGDWPRELPPLAEQELADISLVAELDAKLPGMEVFEHDFAKEQMSSEVFQLPASNPAAKSAYRDDGFHLTVRGTDPDRWHDHHIQHRFALLGDFDITASFEQLKTAFPKKHKYAGVALVACLQTDPYINLWMHRRRSGSETNHQYIETTNQHPAANGEVRWDTWKNRPSESTSGTFRLARRGRTIHYLYADGDSTQFRLHRTSEVSDAPVRVSGLWLFTQVGGLGEASVVWKKVSVRADRIAPHPTAVAANRAAILDGLKRQLTGPLPKAALEFDGAGSHVRIPTLNYDGTYPVTYEAFATPDRLNNGLIIGDTRASGAGLAVNGAYNFHAWDGARYHTAGAERGATIGLRVHVAATLQDGQLRLFVNGKQQPRVVLLPDGKFVASKLPIVVGASPSLREPAVDSPFAGVIDGVRISKGARYIKDFTPPTELKAEQDTIVCLRFTEGRGLRAADSSQNHHQGSIRGAKWVREEALRRRAAGRLAELGSAGVAVLIEALAHENSEIRIHAINGLATAGGEARPAVPLLKSLVGHENQRVSAAAEQALFTIQGNTVLKSLFNLFK